jgi:hypothetical protein
VKGNMSGSMGVYLMGTGIQRFDSMACLFLKLNSRCLMIIENGFHITGSQLFISPLLKPQFVLASPNDLEVLTSFYSIKLFLPSTIPRDWTYNP